MRPASRYTSFRCLTSLFLVVVVEDVKKEKSTRSALTYIGDGCQKAVRYCTVWMSQVP